MVVHLNALRGQGLRLKKWKKCYPLLKITNRTYMVDISSYYCSLSLNALRGHAVHLKANWVKKNYPLPKIANRTYTEDISYKSFSWGYGAVKIEIEST